MIPAPPNGLEIDAYSGADKPASISSPGLCATFTYNRWGRRFHGEALARPASEAPG